MLLVSKVVITSCVFQFKILMTIKLDDFILIFEIQEAYRLLFPTHAAGINLIWTRNFFIKIEKQALILKYKRAMHEIHTSSTSAIVFSAVLMTFAVHTGIANFTDVLYDIAAITQVAFLAVANEIETSSPLAHPIFARIRQTWVEYRTVRFVHRSLLSCPLVRWASHTRCFSGAILIRMSLARLTGLHSSRRVMAFRALFWRKKVSVQNSGTFIQFLRNASCLGRNFRGVIILSREIACYLVWWLKIKDHFLTMMSIRALSPLTCYFGSNKWC